MDTFVNPYKPQEPTAEDRFNYRRQMGINGQQAFQQSQKNTNDTVGNGFFGHMVDAAQANAAGLFAGQLRAVDEGLNWAGEKLGLAEKTGTRDKSGWLEQAAQAMDEVQRRNTAQEELTGLNYLAQQVGSVLGSMAAMTAETVALGGGLSLAGKGVGALARLAGIASKTNAGANVNNIIGASGNLTSKAIGAARKMWGGNYLQNYYKLQMMNSPAEALGQAGNLLKQLEDEGYDRDTIRAAALWSGTLNAAFLPLANMAEGKMVSLGAKAIASNPATPEALKTILKPTMLGVGATLGKAARTSAWQGLTEGGEEATQDYIDQLSTQLAQGKDFKDMEWDHTTAAKSFIDAGVGSAALGFLGGATNYRSRAKNFNANGHNFQLSDDGRTWSVDGKDRIMKPDFNEDGTPAIDKETNKQTESLQPYTAKEIADLMGNDVTEADVRGAMRAEKAKTSKVSSGDARPVAVKPDAKKEETKQQPVPGFTILEDDSGNTIYTDNISGVEYNSKDGWVVPANDNTDGKQLYNINTGNFANANTQRVLSNGDTVDVVSGEVTKKENEVKNTQEDTTVPKKENVITPPVEPAPVAAPAPAPVVDKKADEVPKVQPEAPQVLNKNQEIKLGVARALVDSKHISRAEHQSIAKYINEHPDDDRNMDVIIREVLDRNFEMPSADTIVSGVEKVKEKQAGKKVGSGTTTTTEDGRIIHTYSSNTSANITKALDKLKNELYDTEFITNDEYEKAIEAIYALAKRGERIKWSQMLSAIRGKSFKYPTADEIAKRRLEIENRNKENENAEIVNAKLEEVKSEVLEVTDKGKPEDGEGSKPEEKKVVQEPKLKAYTVDEFINATYDLLDSGRYESDLMDDDIVNFYKGLNQEDKKKFLKLFKEDIVAGDKDGWAEVLTKMGVPVEKEEKPKAVEVKQEPKQVETKVEAEPKPGIVAEQEVKTSTIDRYKEKLSKREEEKESVSVDDFIDSMFESFNDDGKIDKTALVNYYNSLSKEDRTQFLISLKKRLIDDASTSILSISDGKSDTEGYPLKEQLVDFVDDIYDSAEKMGLPEQFYEYLSNVTSRSTIWSYLKDNDGGEIERDEINFNEKKFSRLLDDITLEVEKQETANDNNEQSNTTDEKQVVEEQPTQIDEPIPEEEKDEYGMSVDDVDGFARFIMNKNQTIVDDIQQVSEGEPTDIIKSLFEEAAKHMRNIRETLKEQLASKNDVSNLGAIIKKLETQDLDDEQKSLLNNIVRTYKNSIVDMLEPLSQASGIKGVTIEDVVKRLAANSIANGDEATASAVLKKYPQICSDYYNYLINKYQNGDVAFEKPTETAKGTKGKTISPDEQATKKISAGKRELLTSFINASWGKLNPNYELDENTKESLIVEFNKQKYKDKVKKGRAEKGAAHIIEFLEPLHRINPSLFNKVTVTKYIKNKDGSVQVKQKPLREYHQFLLVGNSPDVMAKLLFSDDEIDMAKIEADKDAELKKVDETVKGTREKKRQKKEVEKKAASLKQKILDNRNKNGISLRLMKQIESIVTDIVRVIGGGYITSNGHAAMVDVGKQTAMKAASSYDEMNESGASFHTWVGRNVENEIKNYLTTIAHTAKLSQTEATDISKMRKAEQQLAQKIGAWPTDEQLAEFIGKKIEYVQRLKMLDYRTSVLNKAVEESQIADDFGDNIDDTETFNVYQGGGKLRYDTENVYDGDKAKDDDTDNASIVADTDVRGKILTPANEETVAKQIEQLFRGMGIKQVSPHVYDINLPFGDSLQIDMTTTSAQLINELGDKVGPLRAIAGVKDGSFAGLYSLKNGINLIRLTDAVRNGTVPHEVAHFIFNAIFSPIERRKIIDYYKTKIADGSGLTEEQLELRAQEIFCDDFAKYFLNQKDVPRSKLQMIFERMKNFLRKLVDMFSFKNHPYTEEELDLRRDDVNVNEESLAALFGRIANGDIYNRGLNQNENAVVVAQLVSERQAMNLNDTAKAVREAKALLDKGMKPTEVWKKTGCLRYDDGTIKMYIPFSNKDIRGTGLPKEFDVLSLPIQQTDAITDGAIDARVATVKLTDILTPNNKFFKLVPSLQNVQVKYVFPVAQSDSAKIVVAGFYDPQTNIIWLRGDKIKAKSVLAHELQHAIQMGSDSADRDAKLSELYPYDIDPVEQEARYAELTFQEENLADGLQRPRHTHETFFEESKRLVRDMYSNKIFRETQNAISEVAESLQSMVDSYKDDNPYPVKDVAALEIQLLSVYNDAAESKDVSESDLGGFAKIYNRLRALSEDFRIRQANILKKTGRLSLPYRNTIGEDTLNVSSTPEYQATIVVRDANGVAIEFDDVPTLDGKPTTDEIGGAIVNADNKVLRKLRKGDTTIKDDVKPKDPIVFDPNATGDENNKFSLLDWLRSPSRLAKKFRKVFEFFAKTFDTAYRVQNQLRYEWHNMLKEATEFLSDSVEDFNLFNDLMLYGDSYGRYNDKGEYENTGIDFDANQLNGMIYYTDADGKKVFVPSDQQFIPEGVETHQLPENVAKAYLKVRELTETIYAAVDRARRSGLIKTEKANLQRILQINDPKNRAEGYIEIKGSDGQYHSLDEFRQYLNDKDTYDIRYAKIRVIDQKAVEVGVSQERVNDIKNDDTLEFVVASENKDVKGTFNVQYVKYMPHMGHRRGHVPHIFERWMVAYVNDDGSYTIQDSQKTVNAARESITKFQEQDADNNVQRQYVIFPKAFDFGSFNGADEVTGGGALATQKQKQEMYVNLIKNYMMTPEEANRAVNAAMRTSVKNRIYGQAVKRKGVAGYSKDVMDALIREVTSASRYCALQPAKHAAIDRYEHLFNMNYNADIKVGDNPLQAMVKSYIDDCNGKPSKAEQLLNRTLNNWDFWRNNISATYGDRAILQAASVANQITSMAKLGFWNISSAVVNLFQNMNTIALCGFGHFGEGVKAFRDLKFKDKDKLTGKELADYLLNEQIIEQTGVKYDIGMDSATGYSMRLERLKNNTDVGTPKGLLQVIYDNYMRIGDKGLALFSGAEAANRQICVLTAYRDGIAKGMTHDEAIEYAREVNKKANFDYGVADTPAFMRAMSGTGVGEMMMLFQKYPVKELELMCEMCKKAMSNTDGDKAQAARFWGMYFLMSGIGGIPFLDGFDEWLEHLFGYKPSKRAKLELIDTFGDNAFTRSVCYGVGATAGIDISQRVGMGDLKFGNSQLMFPFNFGGAAGSTLKQMIEAAMEGDPVHIAKAFSPSIGAVLEAGQGYSTDKKGRLRTLYSVPQMFVRSTGFRPIEDSVNADLNTALTEQRSDDRNEKSKFKYQIALKQTQGQPLTADDQRKLRTMNISGKQLADARKQIKQSFAKRAKELMSKEQRQRYGSVYEDFEREDDEI